MLINRKSINSKVKNESSNKLMKLASGSINYAINSSFKKINSGYFKDPLKVELKDSGDLTSFSSKLINKKKLVKEEIDEDDFFNN